MPRGPQGQEIARRIQRGFGAQLQSARKRGGVGQKTLADALHLSRTSISNIERGTQRVFLDQVYSAAHALGVEIQELLPNVADIYTATPVHTAADDPLPADVAVSAGEVVKTLQQRLRTKTDMHRGSSRGRRK